MKRKAKSQKKKKKSHAQEEEVHDLDRVYTSGAHQNAESMWGGGFFFCDSGIFFFF